MTHYELLAWFSVGLIVVWTLTIILPFMFKKAHLVSYWNFFLVGSIIFVAMSNLAFTQQWEIPLSSYTPAELYDLMLGITIFYITVYVFYYLAPGARTVTGRSLLIWPKVNRRTLILFAMFCIGLTAFFYLPFQIPVISQLARQLGNKSLGFAITMIFIAWYRDRQNPFLTTLLVMFLAYSLLFAITVGTGRRTFITAVAGIPIAIYWLKYRHESRKKTFAHCAIAVTVLGLVLMVYSGVRHRDRTEGVTRDFSYAWRTIQLMPERFLKTDGRHFYGQHSTEFSLLCRRLYSSKPEPFAMTIYVLSNPVPRSLWEDKPVGLGYTLPKDAKAKTRATWGPGIVGHAFHEGSFWFLVLYGGIFAMALRYGDEWTARQPGNPFLIGTMVAVFPHVIGWVRGDCGTFTIQIIGGLLTGVVIYGLIWTYRQGSTIKSPTTFRLPLSQVVERDRSAPLGTAVAFFNLKRKKVWQR